MVTLSTLKYFISHRSCSYRQSSSSTLSSTKIKIYALVCSHGRRIIWALSRARSIFTNILKQNQSSIYPTKGIRKRYKKRKAPFFGSCRLHYNWASSSHKVTDPEPVLDGHYNVHIYYDSTWNSVFTADKYQDATETHLSGNLYWLEEKVRDASSVDEGCINEIDQLAEVFIAKCHEKFILEKQESNRRYHEMLARSM